MAEYSSLSRRGLDKLLALRPTHDVIKVEGDDGSGDWKPWVLVNLLAPDGTVERWAIWRHTGNVYTVDEWHAAADDPTIIVTPLEGGS